MSNRFAAGRITLSLLDRLSEREVYAPSRSRDLRELETVLKRDLSSLLNTKREDFELTEEYVALPESLIMYGLPDFTALSLRNPSEQNRLRRAMEAAIRRFEPRLTSVTVTLELRAEHEAALRFRVDGLLKVEPYPEPITFDTILHADTCQFVVGS